MSTWIDKTYIGYLSPQLERFSWKKATLAACRCPLCGDSHKKKNKTRGFFYQKGNDFFYKCHNCGRGTTLCRLLEEIAPNLHQQYILERWKNGENGHSNYKKPKEPSLGTSPAPRLRETSALLQDLICLRTAPDDNPSKVYLRSRKVPEKHFSYLYHAEHFGDWAAKVDPENAHLYDEPRLVIPFFDVHGTFFGASCRSLDPKCDLRYITLKVKHNDLPKIFGMERFDRRRPGYCVEGPIDSLFLDNALAIVGANALDPSSVPFDMDKTTIVFDNEPRNREIVQHIERSIDRGFRVCLWPKTIVHKDINEMILQYGVSGSEIQKIIDDNTFQGLMAKAQLGSWRRC